MAGADERGVARGGGAGGLAPEITDAHLFYLCSADSVRHISEHGPDHRLCDLAVRDAALSRRGDVRVVRVEGDLSADRHELAVPPGRPAGDGAQAAAVSAMRAAGGDDRAGAERVAIALDRCALPCSAWLTILL